jgi:hypothetical protein
MFQGYPYRFDVMDNPVCPNLQGVFSFATTELLKRKGMIEGHVGFF